MLNPFKRRVPLILQSEAPECGIACVAMIAGYHGFRTDLSAMRMRLSPSMKGVTLQHIAAIAGTMNMSMRGVQAPLQGLGRLRLPAILHWDMNHFVVLTRVEANRISVFDPARGKRVMPLAEASRHYTGVAAELMPSVGFAPRDERQKITAWQLMGTLSGTHGTIAQVILLSLVLEVFAIASPFFVQIVVDRVVVGRDEDLLTLLGLGFALLVLMQVATTAVRGWLGVYLSTTLNMRLLDALFGQLLRLPMVWFEKRNIGDIVSRFRSVDAIQRTLTLTFLESAIDGAMVVLTVIVMLWYSPLLAAIVMGAAVLYGLARWLFYGPQRRALDEQLVHEGRSGTHFIETLRGMMAIKLNLREAARRAAYQNLVVEQVNAGVAVQNLSILHRAANGLIFGLENVAVIWQGTVLVMDGRFSVGMLFGFLSFKLLFLTRVNNLVDKAIDFRMLDLHAERIADIALAEPEPVQPAGAQSPDAPLQIRAERLGFAYGVEGFAFREVDFSVRPGETVAIVGPSGSGKTTLVKVLVGLLDRTEGLVEANGRDLRDWDRSAYRARLGVVMQEDQLFVGTLEDNISFFDPQYHPNLVRAAAAIAGIDDEILAMPMQYNTIVGSLGTALSGGQKQRVLLARALYRKPHVVFLDEAFDQLDLAREREITERLRRLGVGIVIVSHRPESVRNVDRVVHVGQMPQVLLTRTA
ncbi:MAG TPA: peptidase domain-containing ABC transporter [Burkholderiaceae bacterium]|jgi:ATP-binding cassette subfamily B protein RaxB|nr:peptidase domain-containing ABC transporter [Burkholderiaceae bacterium]